MDVLARIDADRKLIEFHLRRLLRFQEKVPKRLAAAMRYCVLSPGKRIRPILAIEAYYACGGRHRDWIIPFCCGLELIHSFSLVHDDLPALDDDNYRRGRLTLHRKFDEATAIIAGDALLAMAFEIFATSKAPCDRKILAIEVIASAIGPAGMAGGQILDIYPPPGADYYRIARLKTAEFIAVAIVTGAILAGTQPARVQQLFKLGIDLGILFQITDDLLDFHTDNNRVLTAGRGLTFDQLKSAADKMASKTEAAFRRLGSDFEFFAQLTRVILNRQR